MYHTRIVGTGLGLQGNESTGKGVVFVGLDYYLDIGLRDQWNNVIGNGTVDVNSGKLCRHWHGISVIQLLAFTQHLCLYAHVWTSHATPCGWFTT